MKVKSVERALIRSVIKTKVDLSGFLPKRKFRCFDFCSGDMELDRIRAWQLFIETSRLGSLALAAEALSFPLPKASRLISSLEDELGFQLLDRTKKPAVLTAEGQALVLDAQGLISQWGILREKADALRKRNFDL
ncbi:MAG: LysR family transcriptional regulator [Parasutterella sp.]